jgi:hypothetical protein
VGEEHDVVIRSHPNSVPKAFCGRSSTAGLAPACYPWCSAVRRDGSCSGQGPSKRGAGWLGCLGIYRPHTRERPPLAAAGKHVSWTNVIRSALPCLVAKSMRQEPGPYPSVALALRRYRSADKLNLERVAKLIGNCPNEVMLNSELELRTVRSNACPSTEDIQDRSGAACH